MNNEQLFANREQAGMGLIAPLRSLKLHDPLLLALPRGGAVVAKPIADALGCTMDLLLCKKIGHPENPELAIGSVCADGTRIQTHAAFPGESEFDRQADRLQEWLRSRYQLLAGRTQPRSYKDRTVVITDDGLATGSTMLAAIRSLRFGGAHRIIVAVPVASTEAAARVKDSADAFICTLTPEVFDAVGQFYRSFPEVTDQEVRELMPAEATAPES